MKKLKKIFITSLFFFSIVTTIQAQKKTVELYGSAGNLTGNVIGNVSMKLETDSLGNYISVKGCYDNKNLFGCFDMSKPASTAAFSGSASTVLKFEGYLTFGGSDGSGYPASSKTVYAMWLILTEMGVTGMYIIDNLSEIIPTENTGILSLSYKK